MKSSRHLVFTITYRGRVKSGSGLTYITTDGLPHRPRQIWSQGEDHDNHYWFPTFDFPSDKMTWELVATVPREDMAVSNGRLVSDVTRGSTRTLTWRQDRPSATYLVSLIVAPLVKIHDCVEGDPGGLLRLPGRQREGVAALPRHARHDRHLLDAHRACGIRGPSTRRPRSPTSSGGWRTSAPPRWWTGCPTAARIRTAPGTGGC